MNYEQAEKDISDKIKSLNISGLDCEVLPENEAAFSRPFVRNRVWVFWNGSDFKPSTYSGGIGQEETCNFELTIQCRKLRGTTGAYNLIKTIVGPLLGFEPTDCRKLFLSKKEIIDFKDNLWTYRVLLSCYNIIMEDLDDELPGDALNQINFDVSITTPPIIPGQPGQTSGINFTVNPPVLTDGVTIAEFAEILTITTIGQTSFSLADIPSKPALSKVFVNGVEYIYGVDYIINITSFIWRNAKFRLTIDDTLEIYYY